MVAQFERSRAGPGRPAPRSTGCRGVARRRRRRELSPVADPVTRTYAARVSIRDANPRVLLGMTATVRFRRSHDDARAARLRVPLTAIFQENGRAAVWVVHPDQRVALRPVSVASFEEDGAVLDSGLQAGERIVVAGVHKLSRGEPVRPVEPAPLLPAAATSQQ